MSSVFDESGMDSWRVGSTTLGVDVASDQVPRASNCGVGAGGVAGEEQLGPVLPRMLVPVLVPIPAPVPVPGIARMVRLPPSAL